MKKLLIASLFIVVGIASASTTHSAPPPGCQIGNGGMHPVCNPPVVQ